MQPDIQWLLAERKAADCTGQVVNLIGPGQGGVRCPCSLSHMVWQVDWGISDRSAAVQHQRQHRSLILVLHNMICLVVKKFGLHFLETRGHKIASVPHSDMLAMAALWVKHEM